MTAIAVVSSQRERAAVQAPAERLPRRARPLSRREWICGFEMLARTWAASSPSRQRISARSPSMDVGFSQPRQQLGMADVGRQPPPQARPRKGHLFDFCCPKPARSKSTNCDQCHTYCRSIHKVNLCDTERKLGQREGTALPMGNRPTGYRRRLEPRRDGFAASDTAYWRASPGNRRADHTPGY